MNVIASQTTVIRLLVRKNNEKQCSVPLTFCNVTWGFAPRNASLIFREGIQQTWHRWIALQMAHISELVSTCTCMGWHQRHIEGILPKVPYLPCVSMAGRALLAGYPRYIHVIPLVPKQLFIDCYWDMWTDGQCIYFWISKYFLHFLNSVRYRFLLTVFPDL